MTTPPRIRARFHDNALSRVTRMYAATLAEIFAETLQNARRAGATRVRISLAGPERRPVVTVEDDGDGIADPAVLLSFGENGWDPDTVRREDAAGMGMLSLAHRGCTVSSLPRAAGGDIGGGWSVDLSPGHFRGEAEAVVHPDHAVPRPHGTAVAFQTTEAESAAAVRRAVEGAARYYPLPVLFEDPPNTPAGGETLQRHGFLDDAVHVERWRAVTFGVFERPRRGYHDPDLNFFGLTVPVRLPEVHSVHGTAWRLRADVSDCPGLELVLPARKEAVENTFLRDMRLTARLAIYRAMAANADPRPTHEDWQRARDAGIDIAPPPPELRPWRPGLANLDDWREPPRPAPVGPGALVMACDPEPPEAQALARAARRTGDDGLLFEADRRLEGYAWYDSLPRIVDVRTTATADGNTHELRDYPTPGRTRASNTPLPKRPDAIRIDLRIRTAAGAQRALGLDADVAFAGEAWACVADALPLVIAGSPIQPHELADLLRDAFFSPSDNADMDSYETQQMRFDEEALHLATRLLLSDDDACLASIADAIRRELFWLAPRDRAIDIRIRRPDVDVRFADAAATTS